MANQSTNEWERFLDVFCETFSLKEVFKSKIFICGSYKKKSMRKLIEIKKIINDSSSSHIAFIESDFESTNEKNFILKFFLLAKFSDKIMMIIDHDKGGHMIEIGIIITKQKYKNITFLFVLRKAKITRMLTEGGFIDPFFTENENLFYFKNIKDLKIKVLSLLDIILIK